MQAWRWNSCSTAAALRRFPGKDGALIAALSAARIAGNIQTITGDAAVA